MSTAKKKEQRQMPDKKVGPSAATACFHCGAPVVQDVVHFDDKAFCCSGCKTVYQILSKNNLCEYYNLNDTPGKTISRQASSNKFDCLELPEVAEKYVVYREGNVAKVVFYLPHIHCSSCLWLLEKLPSIQPGVVASRVLFQRKEVHITFDTAQVSLKQIAWLLAAVGYEPYLPLEGAKPSAGSSAQRTRIIRMGVAGFCLGNIMLLSFPEYLAISPESYGGELTYWFRYLNLLLALPVFFYSAMEFFKPAWQSLRKGFLTIDAPVALAIIITFVRSISDILTNTGGGYFDSMTGIVFLMLVGRILQNRTQQALTFDRDYTSYFPVAAHRVEQGGEVPVMLTNLRADDVIRVYSHEIIPADCILSKGPALIDYSFVTGESVPVRKLPGDLIYAGGRQMDGTIELLLVKDVNKSYLTSLWNQASEGYKKDDSDSFIHPLAKHFTAILLVLTAAVGVYWWFENPSLIWPAVTAMLIVACPCALLLSATFTYGHMVSVLDRFGLYLRSHAVLEKLMKVRHFVFDKTGTITRNDGYIIATYGDDLTEQEEGWLQALAAQSHHPLSRALSAHLRGTGAVLEHVKEIPGKGMETWTQDCHILLGSAAFVFGAAMANQQGSVVAWRIDQRRRGYFVMRAAVRPGVAVMMQRLAKKYALTVLSGDQAGTEDLLRQDLGTRMDIRFAQSPHDKKAFVQQQRAAGVALAMIGDGLNDSGALQEAYAGIAVTDDVNNFSPASDAILEASKLRYFERVLGFLRHGNRVIKWSFGISILYNIVGLSFAATGKLSPMVAAILMPVSSITIIVVTWLGVYLYAHTLSRNTRQGLSGSLS